MNHDLRNIKHFVHNVHSYTLVHYECTWPMCSKLCADPKNVLTKQGSLHKGMTYNLGNVWNVYILRVHQKRK